MFELKNDALYELLERYPYCGADHCIICDDAPYMGEASHRRAIRFALEVFSERFCPDEPFTCEIEKANARPLAFDDFFALPPADWKKTFLYKGLPVTTYSRASDGGPIPYRYAFIDPPHGSDYTGDDLLKVFAAMFPRGRDALEMLEWSTDWSDYFDAGHEWWGASCWSIYDRKLERFIVIMASDTD